MATRSKTPARPRSAVRKTARSTGAKTAAKTARQASSSPATAKNAKVAKAPQKAQPSPSAKPTDKVKKPKLVRDSFTIPKPEYEAIAALKLRAATLGQTPKKSELLRAGLKALAAMGDAALVQCLKAVPSVKTGRPAA